MPIYEYECRGCGHRFEFLVLPSSPESDAECPECQKKDLTRLISLCAVSSEGTREAHLSAARKKAKGVRHDKEYEEHKAFHAEHD